MAYLIRMREESLRIVVSLVVRWRCGVSVRGGYSAGPISALASSALIEELERVELLASLHQVVQLGAARRAIPS